MQSLRSIAFAIGGIAILAAAAVFTMSLTLLVGAVLTASLIARMVATRVKPAPVRVRANRRNQDNMRVWDDGRGKIIDL
ncbi:hypothetical protein ACQQ2Q_17770 [Agrobacterium sp. ES01]|uniref:hypothetical protein n=1 Tax=Agrobacterium sp. ES01 TaxID=3420714 RepID=UPI003D151646